MTTDNLAKLRVPFAANHISKLPKPYKKDSPKGKCDECGGYHGLPAMHLDYVGHAALTDRLLDTDPAWTWEPVALGDDGLPKLDANGGLWIRLTICGVTRLGYGDADGKTGPAAMKERIGDALRNAAMRFGAALDLWHKGDLHAVEDDKPAPMPPAELARWLDLIRTCEPHMVDDTARKAGEAAKKAEDLDAYQAMRQAKLARVAALKKMVGAPETVEV